MLARCEKLDLCQNVFVDGKWGAYRSAHIPPLWHTHLQNLTGHFGYLMPMQGSLGLT